MAQIEELIQGSSEWHAHRNAHLNASDAPAMLGISKYKSRNELLREKATGITPEVDARTQALFDNGHANEAAARPWAEEIIGEELYPVVMSETIDELKLSASLDGLTMMADIAFEHKSLNQALASSLEEGIIPDEYKLQMEQQLLISGASKCLFMASSGNKDNILHVWYHADPDVRTKLLAGWKQFHEDLDNYQYVEPVQEPEGKVPESLPALHIELTGMVTASNLVEFKQTAMAVIGAVGTELKTDADFADAEKAVKWCGEVESRLSAAKNHALSQTASIDELFRTLDEIKEEARTKRLSLEKLVKTRKQSIRADILQGGKTVFAAHIAALNDRIGKPYMPEIAADFAGVMKNKRTVSSLRDAVDTEVARVKIEANAVADKIQINLNTLRDQAADYKFLFSDVKTLLLKENEDLESTIKARISDHKEAEQKRLDAERDKIREEEEAKAAQKVKDEAEHQKGASKETNETETAPTAKQETSTPPPATTGAGRRAAQKQAPVEGGRPTDLRIIMTLALHYEVSESRVIDWLQDMDLEAARAAA